MRYYGDAILEELSLKLTNEFGKGFSKRNLERRIRQRIAMSLNIR